MEIEKIIDLVKRRMKNKKNYSFIGTEIKKRRKQLQMTQDLVANKICSVSYLSKIENNKIEGNTIYLEEIADKLDLDKGIIFGQEKYQKYLKGIIKGIYYGNSKLLLNVYDRIKETDDAYFSELIKFGCLLFLNERKAEESLKKLLRIKETIADEEMIIFLILLVIYNYQTMEYEISVELLNIIESFAINNLYIILLKNKYFFLNYGKLGRLSLHNEHRMNYINNSLKIGALREIRKINIIYALNLLHYGEFVEGKKTISILRGQMTLKERKELLIKELLYTKEYIKCEKLIRSDLSYKENKEKYLLRLFCYYMLEKNEDMLETLNYENNFNYNTEELIFINTVKKYIEGDFYYKRYLKETVFPLVYKSKNYILTKFYGERLLDLLAKDGYKESYLIARKIISLK